ASTASHFVAPSTLRKPYTLKLRADTKGLYCSTDSLTAIYNEAPMYQVAAKAKESLVSASTFMTWNAIALLGLLIAFPLIIGLYIYTNWKLPAVLQPQKIKPAGSDGEKPGDRSSGPFSIEFKNQDYKI